MSRMSSLSAERIHAFEDMLFQYRRSHFCCHNSLVLFQHQDVDQILCDFPRIHRKAYHALDDHPKNALLRAHMIRQGIPWDAPGTTNEIVSEVIEQLKIVSEVMEQLTDTDEDSHEFNNHFAFLRYYVKQLRPYPQLFGKEVEEAVTNALRLVRTVNAWKKKEVDNFVGICEEILASCNKGKRKRDEFEAGYGDKLVDWYEQDKKSKD